MVAQPVQANVVLTADNSQYDQAMDQSSSSTAKLASSVDSLSHKIGSLTKSAGKHLLGISALDVGVITGATAAWASYEKQMSRLQAQSAVVSHTQAQQTLTMKNYTASVKNLRDSFGTSTADAAALTQAISKLTGSSRQVQGLTTVFQKMSMATGESSTGLATSVLQLQKMMGTPTSATSKYADQLTYLAAKSNTTAGALADFTSQLAPMGRSLGMTQTQVTGFANMFTKAGQDGYTSATAFAKVTQDIAQAVQTGSPDLKQYASLLGVTVGHFKNMGGAEQVAGFLDRINQLGPKAAQVLNQFGFDGIRMAKAITGTVQASGGAMNAIREAGVGFRSDSVDKGAKAAENMSTVLAKLHQDIQTAAEDFAKILGPGILVVAEAVEKLASGFEALMAGPLGKFAQLAAAVLVPLTAMIGGMALLAGTVLKVGSAMALLRSSPMYGLKEGFQGGSRIVMETENGLRTGNFIAGGGEGSFLRTRGAQIAERGTWGQRLMYNSMQSVGATGRMGAKWLGGVGSNEELGTPGLLSRGVVGGINMGSSFFRSGLEGAIHGNPADRTASMWLKHYFPGQEPQIGPKFDASNIATAKAATSEGLAVSTAGMRNFGATGAAQDQAEQATKKMAEEELAAAKAASTVTASMVLTAAGADEETIAEHEVQIAQAKNVKMLVAVQAAGMDAAAAMTEAAAGAVKFSAATAAAGLKATAGAGAGKLAGALGMSTGGLGLMAGLIALPFAIEGIHALISHFSSPGDQSKYVVSPTTSTVSSYLNAGKITDPGATIMAGGPQYAGKITAAPTFDQAMTVNPADVNAANTHKLSASGKLLAGMNKQQALTYLAPGYGLIANNPAQLQSLKLDLMAGGMAPNDVQSVMTNLASNKTGTGMGSFLPKQEFASVFGHALLPNDVRAKTVSRALDYIQTTTNRAAYQGMNQLSGQQQSIAGYAQLYGSIYAGATPTTSAFGVPEAGQAQLSGAAKTAADTLTNRTKIKTSGNAVTASSANKKWADAVIAAREQWIKGGGSPQTFAMLNNYISDVTLGTGDKSSVQKLLLGYGAADTTATGVAAYNEAWKMQRATGTPAAEDPQTKAITKGSVAGAIFEGSSAAQSAINQSLGNTVANTQGLADISQKLADAGQNMYQGLAGLLKVQGQIGTPDTKNYQFVSAAIAQQQQDIAAKQSMMTPSQRIQSAVDVFQSSVATRATTPDAAAAQDQAKQNVISSFTAEYQQLKQMQIATQQFHLQESRQTEAYNLQRGYEEHDYQLSRSRAEEAYDLQRKYSMFDYYLSVQRSEQEFNIQRTRAQQDFQHSVLVGAEQLAQSYTDIYSRIEVQQTASASWLASNASDQLAKMKEQKADLDKLRKEGLSNTAIEQLHLTDPAEQQQLERLMGEMTPALIKKFNTIAGTQRVAAAKGLFTDPGSLQWDEMRRSENRSMNEAQADFNRHAEENHADFVRSLARNRTQYNISMDQMAEDFATQMSRQEDQYHLIMKQAAQDFANMGKDINESLEHVLKWGVDHMTGYARQQAQATLDAFNQLRTQTSPVAVGIMQDLAKIFGFKYVTPPGVATTPGGGENTHQMGGPIIEGKYTGGVVPGWNPGRDTHTIAVGGGEGILRPEATRAIGGEKVIDAINHLAIHGAFAAGGVFRPIDEPVSRGLHDQYTGYAAVDLAAPVGTPVYAVSGGRISQSYDIHGPLASDQYHDAKYGPYGSYGRVMYLKTDVGPEVIYAHLSKRGYPAGAMVKGGEPIAASGSTGNSSGPHLHFGDSDGNPLEFIVGAAMAHGMISGSTMTAGRASLSNIASIDAVLKKYYPKAENAAASMRGIHPLHPGDISTVLNRYAVKYINQHGGIPTGAPTLGFGAAPTGDRLTNENIVHTAAKRIGWGGEWPSLYKIMMAESGFDNTAQNPSSSAYGMFQFLDSTWGLVGGHKTSNPWQQSKYGLQYIADTYSDPNNAWKFHLAHGWYGDGSVFTSPNVIGVGENGPEAVIPLNQRGGEFLGNAMARSVGLGSSPVNSGGVHLSKTQIDHSTNFTGPITVQASNPADLISQLQARQRVLALSRPVLTGSAA